MSAGWDMALALALSTDAVKLVASTSRDMYPVLRELIEARIELGLAEEDELKALELMK